jgi:hypothetical protein
MHHSDVPVVAALAGRQVVEVTNHIELMYSKEVFVTTGAAALDNSGSSADPHGRNAPGACQDELETWLSQDPNGRVPRYFA